MKDMSASLGKSDCILATESHRVYTTRYQYSTSYMAKNIRSRNGCISYIYFQVSGIYTSSLRKTFPRKVQIAKILGLMPLNISFMTKLGLKVVIIAKMIYSVKVKMCQFICNAQIHAHIYLNYTLRDVLGRVWLQVDSSEKGCFGGRVNLMPVLLLWLPPLWL